MKDVSSSLNTSEDQPAPETDPAEATAADPEANSNEADAPEVSPLAGLKAQDKPSTPDSDNERPGENHTRITSRD